MYINVYIYTKAIYHFIQNRFSSFKRFNIFFQYFEPRLYFYSFKKVRFFFNFFSKKNMLKFGKICIFFVEKKNKDHIQTYRLNIPSHLNN